MWTTGDNQAWGWVRHGRVPFLIWGERCGPTDPLSMLLPPSIEGGLPTSDPSAGLGRNTQGTAPLDGDGSSGAVPTRPVISARHGPQGPPVHQSDVAGDSHKLYHFHPGAISNLRFPPAPAHTCTCNCLPPFLRPGVEKDYENSGKNMFAFGFISYMFGVVRQSFDLKVRGSSLLAKKNLALGPPGPGPSAKSSLAMSHAP